MIEDKPIPTGALPEEKADDVPAMLSEGEYVFPAEVVRFYGLQKITAMHEKAKQSLEEMGEGTQEPQMAAVAEEELPFGIDDIDMDAVQEFAAGGFVQAPQNPFGIGGYQQSIYGASPTQGGSYTGSGPGAAPGIGNIPTYGNAAQIQVAPPQVQAGLTNPFSGGKSVKYYRNSAGDVLTVEFINGVPTSIIPAGYSEFDPNADTGTDATTGTGVDTTHTGGTGVDTTQVTGGDNGPNGPDGPSTGGDLSGFTLDKFGNTIAKGVATSIFGPLGGLGVGAYNSYNDAVAAENSPKGQYMGMGQQMKGFNGLPDATVPGVSAVSDFFSGNPIGRAFGATSAQDQVGKGFYGVGSGAHGYATPNTAEYGVPSDYSLGEIGAGRVGLSAPAAPSIATPATPSSYSTYGYTPAQQEAMGAGWAAGAGAGTVNTGDIDSLDIAGFTAHDAIGNAAAAQNQFDMYGPTEFNETPSHTFDYENAFANDENSAPASAVTSQGRYGTGMVGPTAPAQSLAAHPDQVGFNSAASDMTANAGTPDGTIGGSPAAGSSQAQQNAMDQSASIGYAGLNGAQSIAHASIGTNLSDQEQAQAAADADASGAGPTIICTALYKQGYLPHEVLLADAAYGATLDPAVLRGYRMWATPIANLMVKSKTFAAIMAPITVPWAQHMYGNKSWLGNLYLKVGVPICKWLGK